MLDLRIEHAVVVTPEGLRTEAVNVRDGSVVGFGGQEKARETVDAAGRVLLPGLVDLHVHFSEPGRDWEGWDTGTRSAAAGGVTTVVDMPLNAVPATVDAGALRLKLEAAQGNAHVDYALWGGLVRDNRAEVPDLLAGGVIGLKAFMYDTTDPTFPPAPDGILYTGMAQLAAAGRPLSVHAENSDLIHTLMADLRGAGRADAQAWLDAHPPVSEVEAVARALRFAAATGCPLHLVHISLPESVRLIAEAKRAGVRVTCEVCAHHLALTGDDFRRLGPVAKCAPPLREAPEVEGLWELLLAGEIDTVASDHSPCTEAMKEGDIWSTWGGINALQLTLPLMLTLARQRGLGLEQLAELCCTRPAEIAGLTRKGRIAPGLDADFVLVDPEAVWTLRRGDLLTRHPWSPFLGQTFQGRVEQVWLRGQSIFGAGGLQPGHGRWLAHGPESGRTAAPTSSPLP